MLGRREKIKSFVSADHRKSELEYHANRILGSFLMYFYPARLGILISWKGTKGRGNPRKNSVENPPMLRVKNPGVEDGRKSAKQKHACLLSTRQEPGI
jgi:hypothetical protein